MSDGCLHELFSSQLTEQLSSFSRSSKPDLAASAMMKVVTRSKLLRKAAKVTHSMQGQLAQGVKLPSTRQIKQALMVRKQAQMMRPASFKCVSHIRGEQESTARNERPAHGISSLVT